MPPPRLRFTTVSIAVHVLLQEEPDPTSTGTAMPYQWSEFLSYAYRASPPFTYREHQLPAGLDTVGCAFPPAQVQTSGGSLILPAGPTAFFGVDAVTTRFSRSGKTVLSVRLERKGDPAPLSELEAIRFVKTWEAGEGAAVCLADEHGLLPGPRTWVEVTTRGRPTSVLGLVEEVRRHVHPMGRVVTRPGAGQQAFVTGSLQLVVPAPQMNGLVRDIGRLHEPVRYGDDLGDLQALSGVLRGLTQFLDAPVEELPAIFAETSAESRLISAVHKGTFLRVGSRMRIPSIYFLLPQAIALSNEGQLRAAVATASTVLGADQGTGRWRANRIAATRRRVERRLAECVDPAVIHYPSLRELYVRAASSRGLDGLAREAESRSVVLRTETETVRSRQQSVLQGAIAAIATALAAMQVFPVAIPWIAVALVGVLVAIGAWIAVRALWRRSR